MTLLLLLKFENCWIQFSIALPQISNVGHDRTSDFCCDISDSISFAMTGNSSEFLQCSHGDSIPHVLRMFKLDSCTNYLQLPVRVADSLAINQLSIF
jgi:hypothetical protein